MQIRKLLTLLMLLAVACSMAQRPPAAPPKSPASPAPAMELIQPEQMVKLLQAGGTQKPLVLQIGFQVLYQQAHIPGAEYIGPASDPHGLQQLRERVKSLPHRRLIVLYCGCCPWARCPNVEPAYRELRSLGFQNVKALYIANNFGSDWVEKGYPVAKEQ